MDYDVVDCELFKDPLIGRPLQPVALLHPLFAFGKRVGVLHDELPAPYQACAGTRLISVLGLNLVEGDGQIPVGGQEALGQEGEGLLVSGGQKVVRTVAVFELEDVVSVLVPPSGGRVDRLGQEGRKVDLLGSDGSHFLSDHFLHVFQDFEPQRKPGENPRRHLADVSSAHQELGRIHVLICGVVPQGAGEKFGKVGRFHNQSFLVMLE